MSTWTKFERVTRTVVYDVPTHGQYACWSEVISAIQAALNDYRDAYPQSGTPSDDSIRVVPGDDSIRLEFEVPNA